MRRYKIPGKLTGFLLLLAMIGFVFQCQEQQESADAAKTQSMIIVFSSGAKVVRANQELEAKVGAIVNQGDILKTEQGILDLQTRSGSAIRVREFTTISVTNLFEDKTKLDLKHGTVLARVKRQSKNEKFTIATPTAIAGVRGTTFKVEFLDMEKPPRVKVIDGKVAMSPRIQALEKYSKSEIESSQVLKNLAALEKKETILEKETSGTISLKLDKQVKEINKAVTKAQEQKKDPDSMKKVERLTKKIAKVEAAPVVTTKEEITVQDVHDTSAMVAVDSKTFDRIVQEPEATKETSIAQLKIEYEKKRDVNQEKILKKIEAAANKKKLKTEKEIKKQYNKFELVVLKDGTKIRGAVIATTKDVLMVHTKAGVKRVNKDLVDYQQMLY